MSISTDFANLKDKVVVLTGGASGIGASTVRLFSIHGAHVVFGDLALEAGSALVASLSPASPESTLPKVTFVPTDTAIYADVVRLFKTALALHGHVDHAVACAGVLTPGADFFALDQNVESVELKEPDTSTLDVNLKGSMYFARVALVYLRHVPAQDSLEAAKEQRDSKDERGIEREKLDKSLTLIASDMPFIGVAQAPLYQVSKMGVLELMRVLRPLFQSPLSGHFLSPDEEVEGRQKVQIRVNAVCPSATVTPMIGGLSEAWQAAGLHINTPEMIGQVILRLAAFSEIATDGGIKKKAYGMALDVVGGEAWDIEEGLERSMGTWLGERGKETVLGARRLFKGMGEAVWDG
ncbi:hypothetical protein H2199_002709 [Coniosporium tulheliwenetii]|uniref:Uncharacterized protein n=1 Tax=Coniosporium tulheliwenetii TaxID=3383036 RepID=A0ACC2ZDA6_9PEZI|nr:hypothetical protein H2199_002709 [Cladosporium sp. JES 115]